MIERNIDVPDLFEAIKLFVNSLDSQALPPYAISTDHAPSEQIDGSLWHTSVFVISPRMEHHALAIDLGNKINQQTHVLKQWKSSNKSYKRKFHQEFFHTLKNYPVLVIVLSAQEKTILSQEHYFAQQLGISGCYKKIKRHEKLNYEFGPYHSTDNNNLRTLIVSEKHAPMAFFLAHCLLEIHTLMNIALNEKHNVTDSFLRMAIWSDKPPNDFNGNYAELMWLLLGSSSAQGKFTWGGFTGNDDQEIDLLADNLAGLFDQIIRNPEQHAYKGAELQPPITGVFNWSKLNVKSTAVK